MLRKLFRAGNSLVVSLPRETLELLSIRVGTEASIDLDLENRQILITPHEEPLAAVGIDEVFAKQMAEFIEQYRPALEALSR